MEDKTNSISRSDLERLIFGDVSMPRFTQDSPFLPDVWIKYGQNPGKRIDVLINPYGDTPPGKVCLALKERLKLTTKNPIEDEGPEIAYNKSVVVAKLRFEELIQAVLPMTFWWNEYVIKKTVPDENEDKAVTKEEDQAEKKPLFNEFLRDEKQVVKDIKVWNDIQTSNSALTYPPEWIWMIRVIGRIWGAGTISGSDMKIMDISDDDALEMFTALMRKCPPLSVEQKSLVFSVSLNRPANAAIWRSTVAVKADSGRILFNVSCKKLFWAIVDSGIDATHPAFRRRDADDIPETLKSNNSDLAKKTRVKATYDFTKIRGILADADKTDESKLVGGMEEIEDVLGKLFPGVSKADMSLAERTQSLRTAINSGFHINWEVLEPFLRVPHNENYKVPRHEHGTHVAGILAGDWRKDESKIDEKQDLIGMCPDINLYDFRVLGDDGFGDEFSVMAALQFIRYLNSHQEFISVHGVNMSLSIHHDVVNYACGNTPICEECNRLANSGTVMIAAAGNQGYLKYLMADGQPTEGYRSISVTDPGNAESVITVGSTHSTRPHSYGVSYFSSRGPTGDGRIKPDVVAPGEKIKSPIPGGKAGLKDGTSMAAPHVSGAAAMLMARHSELVGNPQRLKAIICKTATDLGRERYFQGAGMIDILRALQSI